MTLLKKVYTFSNVEGKCAKSQVFDALSVSSQYFGVKGDSHLPRFFEKIRCPLNNRFVGVTKWEIFLVLFEKIWVFSRVIYGLLNN